MRRSDEWQAGQLRRERLRTGLAARGLLAGWEGTVFVRVVREKERVKQPVSKLTSPRTLFLFWFADTDNGVA